MPSFKVMVKARGETQLTGNAIRLATRTEAEEYALGLAIRWTAVETWEVQPSDNQPNYKYVNGKVEPIASTQSV